MRLKLKINAHTHTHTHNYNQTHSPLHNTLGDDMHVYRSLYHYAKVRSMSKYEIMFAIAFDLRLSWGLFHYNNSFLKSISRYEN